MKLDIEIKHVKEINLKLGIVNKTQLLISLYYAPLTPTKPFECLIELAFKK